MKNMAIYGSKFFLINDQNLKNLHFTKYNLLLNSSNSSLIFDCQNLNSFYKYQYTDIWFETYFNLLKNKGSYKISDKNSYINNENILINKLVNYCNNRGLKRKAYKYYSDYIKIFYSFFNEFNEELNTNYPLYSVYFDFAKKNKNFFFSIIFIYQVIISYLEPTFLLTSTKKKKKKKKEIIRTIDVKYVKPQNRVPLAVRLVNLFSKTFVFRKSHLSKCYALLNTFLENKNSTLYKKKIYTYNKLFLQKKLKK